MSDERIIFVAHSYSAPLYVGYELEAAIKKLSGHGNGWCIEKWLDGKCVETIYA